ncbi:MAG: hypothetical protein HYY35_01305 [Deltaproteobacteria bacterium]|nr:hypothetical protein [Deltaproteobacteria bacterium]
MIPKLAKLDGRALWRTISHNWMLKLASIAFAVGLWGFVNLGAREAEMSLFVPLELRNLPPGLMITNPLTETASARLRGPRTILGTIDEGRQRIPLDLSNVGPGSTSFRIDAELLNLPRGVSVTRLSPVQVTLDVERVVERMLPVVTNLAGAVPAGFRVVESEIRPPSVSASGPSSVIGALRNIPTGPLHLAATSGNFEQSIVLERPADLVRLSPDRVVVRGRVEEILTTQDFRDVQIGVHNPPEQYRLRQRSADVTLRGPQRLMKQLHLSSQNVFVDLLGAAGQHAARVQAEVPEGVQVIEIRPAEVRVDVSASPGHKPRKEAPQR